MKKLLVTLLAASMCLSMLAGCGSSNDESQATNDSTTTENSTTDKDSSEVTGDVELKEFTILGDHASTYYKADDLEEFEAIKSLRKLMEAKGVDLKIELVQDDQYLTTLQTRFAAMNNVPMYAAMYRMTESEVMALAEQGIVLDINELLDLSDGTAKAFFTENDFGVTAYNKVCTPDGNFYWLPNIYITKWEDSVGETGTNYGVNIRKDWLDKYNLTMPTTTDEFKNALKTFNTNDPSGSGVSAGMNVYSYNPCDWGDAIAQWFGLPRSIVGANWDEKKAVSPWHCDTVKDYFTYMQDLSAEGLIDPEMVGSNDQLNTKVANNQVGASSTYILATGWEPTIEAAFKADAADCAEYVQIDPIEAVKGVTPLLALEDPVYVWDEFVFTNQLTDKDLGAAFLDVYFSDEQIDLINYGTEGVNYDVVNGEKVVKQYTAAEDGKQFDADQLNQYLQDKADQRLSYGKILYSRLITSDMNFYDLKKAAEGCVALGWAKDKYDAQEKTRNYGHWTSIDVTGTLATASKEDADTVNMVWNDMVAASQQAISALVLNQKSVDEIDSIVATLDSAGLTEVEKVYQARYDRFLGK